MNQALRGCPWVASIGAVLLAAAASPLGSAASTHLEPCLPPLAPHHRGRRPRQEFRRPVPVPGPPLRNAVLPDRSPAAGLRHCERRRADRAAGPAPLSVPGAGGL